MTKSRSEWTDKPLSFLQVKVLPQQLVIWLCSYGVHAKSDLTMGATPTNVAPDLNSGREQIRRPQYDVNALSLVNFSRAGMSGERGVGWSCRAFRMGAKTSEFRWINHHTKPDAGLGV